MTVCAIHLAQCAVANLEMVAPLVLAYRPFLDPLPGVARMWWLTIMPLSVLIAVTYKAVRINSMRDMGRYWQRVAVMSMQIVALMVALAAGLHVIVEFIAPAAG